MKITTVMFTTLVFALMTLPVALTSFDEVTHNVADFNEGSLRLDNPEGIRPETGIITSEIPTHTSSDGTLLTVYEYSEGTIQDRRSMSNESTTFYPQIFEIPAGWSTRSVTAISSNIYHLNNWITNSHFSDIANWYQQENDPPGVLTESYDSINDWITITRVSGGKVQYDYWGAWNQTVIINEGGAATAQLNITYRITTSSGANGQNAQPYVFINGTKYELPTGGSRFSVDQDWTTYSIDLPLEGYIFPGVLEISVGIQGFENTQFQTTGVLYCDDILLTMKTSRLVEVIDLKARDKNDPSNVVSFETGAGGKGYAELTGLWTDQVELEFLANESSTEFTCDLYMPITMENHLLTNTYTVTAGSNATWLSEFTAREMPFPFSYWYFNVSIPRDWTIDFVYDPYDDIQLAGTTYYNATYDEISSVLTCDVAGTGPTGTPHYGRWVIRSTSPNYGSSISFLGDSGGSWIPTSVFYPSSPLRVGITFLDEIGNPPTTAGNGTLEFYDYEDTLNYLESGGSLDLSGTYLYKNGTGSTNITIDPYWLAGPVTTIASWSNGTSVGEIRSEFYIYHRTSLEVESAQYTAYRGDIVTLRVRFVDTENGLGIAGGSMWFSWAYGSGTLSYAGNGWYAGAVDTSIAPIGSHLVTTNASKPYYDYVEITGTSIEIQEKTTLYSPKDLRIPTTEYEIAWGNSETVYLAYEDSIAMNPMVMSASPGSPSSPDVFNTYTSNNVYTTITSVGNSISLTVETDIDPYNILPGGLSALNLKIEGQFSTTVTGSVHAYNFSSSSWVQVVSSYSPLSDSTITWKTSKPIDFISGTGMILARIDASASSSFTYSLDIFDFVAFRPVDNTVPAISVTSDWPAQSTVGTQIGPVYNSALRIWEVTLNTAGVTPGEYVVMIEASATGHQSKTLELTITVRAHHTRVTAPPPTETPWGWKTWITVAFTDIDNASVMISESNITQIEVASSYGTQVFTSSSWVYSITSGHATISFWLDTSQWTVDRYNITISVSTAGSGVAKTFDDDNTALNLVVREHDIRVTVNPPSDTPWAWRTNIQLTIQDLDNFTLLNSDNVSQIVIAGQVFTTWEYSLGIFTCVLDTSSWEISQGTYAVSVTTTSGPKFYGDGVSDVQVSVRSHNIQLFVLTPSPTPWGLNTILVIEIMDLDNGTVPVPQSNLTTLQVGSQTFTSSDWFYEDKGTYVQLTVTLSTDNWLIQQSTENAITLFTSGSGSTKYYEQASASVYITIHRHSLLVTVVPPSPTPWGNDTSITVNVIDLNLQALIVPESNITSIVIGGQTFTSATWTYSNAGTYATITVIYSTNSLAVGEYTDISVLLTTTGAGTSKFFTDANSEVDISVRAHGTALQVHPIPNTPWGQTTSVSFTLNDLDHPSSYIPVEEISYLWVSGVVYTSTNFTYVSGVITIILDTSGYGIGNWPKSAQIVFAGVPKNYSSTTCSLTVVITAHTISVEAMRPQATPWSENTTITIRVRDISTPTNMISTDNVTQIVINGVIITWWVYDNGNFTVVLDTDSWTVGTYYSLSISIVTAQSVVKFYANGATSITVEIRNRYTETYSPASSPVPYPDDLVFTITFRDRDADRALVNLTKIYLNGSSYTEGVDYIVVWTSLGTYQVTFHTLGLFVGDQVLIIVCERNGFENATALVRFVIRFADTNAIASGYNFNIPLGENATLTIQFRDEDRSINILGATVICNWAEVYVVTDIGSDGIYEIILITKDTTTLGTYSVQFTLSKTNYETVIITITLKVSTHATYLSYDEAVVATGIGANIIVAMFYQDLSLDTGIGNSSGNVLVSIYNAQNASAIFFVENNVALGLGHYLILIPANQFGGIGYRDFTVYFNWIGSLKYNNLTRSFTVEIRGTDTDLVVAVSPQAVYYGNLINFTVLYKIAESGSGITNSSGDIIGFAMLITLGQSVTSGDFYIFEVNEITRPGQYRITLDTSLLTNYGEFTIRVWLNCSSSSPLLYQNQTLDITVTVLIRTTLLDINPPQNTAFDEQAVFTFAYYDSPTNTKIDNSSQLSVTVTNPGLDYVKSYNVTTRIWTIIVETSSLGSVGTFSLQLFISWSGAPFYQNQTRTVSLTVTKRPSQLTYEAPTPTFYNSNNTIEFTYIDLIDDSSLGLSGSQLVLTSPGLTLLGHYTVVDNADGTYTIKLNTTAFNEPGSYTIAATITYSGSRFVNNAAVSFVFKVLFRAIVATVEPAGSIAWESNIVLTLHVTDGETGTAVFNATGGVNIGLGSQNSSSPDIGGVAAFWESGTDTYTLTITNTLSIGTYLIYLNISYDNISPYYGYKVVLVSVTIRPHSTELQLSEAPETTGYGLTSSFELFYLDLDTDAAIGTTVLVVQNASLAGYWNVVTHGDGFYTVEIDTSVFLTIGTFWVTVVTQNTGTLENYQNTLINVKLYVRERYTLLTYDPIVSTSYTTNVTIVVYYLDSDSGNTGIDNSTYSGALMLTTNASTYYVSVGATAGSFVIELPANQFTPFTITNLQIYMNFLGSPFFQNKTIFVNFQIRGTATEFVWDPTSPVPFGDMLNLTFYWGDTDSGLPVLAQIDTNMSVEVTCISHPSLDTSNPAIVNVLHAAPSATHARFYLMINTSYLDSVGTYVFTITLEWTNENLAPYYESQMNRVVSIVVRTRNTAVPQIAASPVIYGEDITILLQYVDLDASSQLITGGALTISVLNGVSYSVNYTPNADGFFEIYVPTQSTSFLGSMRLNLTVIWTGAPHYENQTAVSVVAIVTLRIANLEINYPVATNYLDNITFIITLQDIHTLEWMDNNVSSFYAGFILPVGVTGAVDILPLGNGQYQIVFNTTVVGQIGQYKLRLTFNHSYYSPYYAQITRDITGSITLRTTSLDYEPIMAVPYSNTMSFNLTYADVDASKSITSGFVNISCGMSVQELELGVNFWVNYKENGIYQVDIDTTALGAPQSYSLSIIVGSATEWWLSHYTMSVSVTVDYRMVGMDVISPDSASYDDVSHFQFTLTDLDSGDPLTGMTSFFSVLFTMPTGVNSSYVVISDVGAGVYNVSFDTNILNQLSDYQITISFDFGLSPDYWRSVSRSVSGRVIARPTQLSYEVDGSTPYLDNITIALDFEDIGTSVGVSGAAITTTSGSATLVQNLNYWVSEQADGHYVLLIDSTVFGDIGYYTISISAEYSGDPYFTNKTRLVILEVRERATRLTYTMPQETPYGNNVSFLMSLVDVDDALTGIAGAESYFSLVSVNSTSVDSSYYWITSTTTQGIYHFYLNTSRLTIFGHYTLNITINGMVLSHYQSQIILVEVDVRERNTQLTTAPISQTPYTNNATIIFYVLDKDANIGVTNTTEGVLFTVNTTISWWVTETSSGTYVMKMNVTQLGSDGQFDFEVIFSWVNDKPFYASRSVKFTITVTGSTSVISYTPTNDIPIGEDIIFSVSYKDSSTGIGISNSSGNIHITLTTLNSTPAGVFQYSLQNPSLGVYVFTINSTPFWSVGPVYFQLNVTWTAGILPYYPDINGTTIRAVIRAIYTQTLADAPDPGTVPAGDPVNLVIGYYDMDHDVYVASATVDTNWPGSWSYTVLGDGRLNITFQTTGVPTIGKITVLITFTKMFYLAKTASVSITIRLITTTASSTYPDPAIAPVGDTVSMEVTFTDIDHAATILNANIMTSWSYGWSWIEEANGIFSVTLETAGVTNLIKYTVIFTLSKDGYQTSQITVKFDVRQIRTAITVDVPSRTVAGSNVTVTVTIEDLDHNTGVEGATILTTATSGTYLVNELGGGIYTITYFLWESGYGTYNYDITGLKDQHAPSSINIDINIVQVKTTIMLGDIILLMNWGENYLLVVNYDRDDVPLGPVAGANVTAEFGSYNVNLAFNGTTYNYLIDTTLLDAGTYLVTVNAEKPDHESRIQQMTMIVAILQTSFVNVDGVYSYAISSGQSITVTVYYQSIFHANGIDEATVAYSWDYGIGNFAPNGTTGFYTATINTTGAHVNIYTLYVRANLTNHAEASIYLSIDVRVIDTELAPIGPGTVEVVYGELVPIILRYHSPILVENITGALVSFRFSEANYTGTMALVSPGVYSAYVDTTMLSSGSFTVYVTATKAGYETGTVVILLQVARIDTQVTTPDLSVILVYEQLATLYFNYTDTYYSLPVENATLEYRWQGGEGVLEAMGNGLYRGAFDSSQVGPGLFYLYVTASKSNYRQALTMVTIQVEHISTDIIVDTIFDVPVGDNLTIYIYFNDTSYSRPVVNALGTAMWIFGNPELQEVTPGNYSFTVPSDIAIGSYSVTLILSKTNYSTSSHQITVIVRSVSTQLFTVDGSSYVSTSVGSLVTITVKYLDIDHNLPITGASISITQLQQILEEDDWTVAAGSSPGEYVIQFISPVDYEFNIVIHAELGDNYQIQDLNIVVVSVPSTADPFMTVLYLTGSFGMILSLFGALLYVKVFSIPKRIREMNRMVKALSKGKIPKAPEVLARNAVLAQIANEILEPVKIEKPIEEFPVESVDLQIPETEDLLMELAELIGLDEEHIEAFRKDIAAMKPSERPSFLNEVIQQERARRAQDLDDKVDKGKAKKKLTPEELEDLRQRFLNLGIAPDEVELLMENAKELTRSEIESLMNEFKDSDS